MSPDHIARKADDTLPELSRGQVESGRASGIAFVAFLVSVMLYAIVEAARR